MTHALLPRLANFIALRSPNETRRQVFAKRLAETPDCRVLMPAGQWVVGVLDLPWSCPADNRDEKAGFFLAEGQHLLPATDSSRRDQRHYLHKAPQRPSKFNEDVEDLSFLSIQPDGDATLLRSLGGRIPGYWWPAGEDLFITTNATLLVTLAGHSGQPDPLITALCLTGAESCFVNRRAYLTNVLILGKAECLSVSAYGNCQVSAHWQPMAASDLRWPSRQQREDRLLRFRAELTSCLHEGLSTTGSNLLALSGGVDSSLLLGLSVGQLKRPVASMSIIPAENDPTYSREMARHHLLRGMYPTSPHLDITADDPNQYDIWRRLKPAAIPMFNPTMAGLVQLDSTQMPCVSFGGEQADEVCGSRIMTPPDWLLHTSTWRALTLSPRHFPSGLKRGELLWRHTDVTARAVRDRLPLTRELLGWLHRDLHVEWASIRAALTVDMQKTTRTISNPLLWLSHLETDWQAMQWEWCSAQGVHRLNPFSTSRIIALSQASHPTERLARLDKQLSRNAFFNELPESLLNRPDKGAFGNISVAHNAMDADSLNYFDHDTRWLALRDPSCERDASTTKALPADYHRFLFFSRNRKNEAWDHEH